MVADAEGPTRFLGKKAIRDANISEKKRIITLRGRFPLFKYEQGAFEETWLPQSHLQVWVPLANFVNSPRTRESVSLSLWHGP